jgi:Tol biopolymer transport system component
MICRKGLCLLISLVSATTWAQPRITSVTTATTGEQRWGFARFAPDGKRILYTTLAYDGIWEYTIATRATRQITADAGSGYQFAVSPDGRSLAYRRTVPGKTWRDRRQEVVSVNLTTKKTTVLGSGRSLSTPVYDGTSPAFIQSGAVFNPAPSKNRTVVLGIDNGKVQLLVNGQRKELDPFNGGSYIWPSLSPDRKTLLAYDMDRGAFVSDLSGNVLAKLGGMDAPVWTRDGAWIISFDEVNDGHAITGSDLHAIKPDGSGKVALTATPDVVELYPSASPAENMIVCHTLDGKILLMTYEVRP